MRSWLGSSSVWHKQLPKSRPPGNLPAGSLDPHRDTLRESRSHVHQPWGFRDGAGERRARTSCSWQDSAVIPHLIAPGPPYAKSENDSKFPSLWAVSPENSVPQSPVLITTHSLVCQRGAELQRELKQVRSKEEKSFSGSASSDHQLACTGCPTPTTYEPKFPWEDFPGGAVGKNPPVSTGTRVRSWSEILHAAGR